MRKFACLAASVMLSHVPAIAAAQQIGETAGPPQGHVAIELNAADTDNGACRLTFIVQNGHPAPIAQAVYEMVLFSADGRVARLTLFDFGTLPVGRPRVRQFDVPELPCDMVGQVLVNGAGTCDGPDLPDGACDAGLRLNSRTEIEMVG